MSRAIRTRSCSVAASASARFCASSEAKLLVGVPKRVCVESYFNR